MESDTEPRLRWLLLDLNSYFASVEQELRPELRGRPVAVVPVMADTTCAIAASYEAKAFGVRTGTRVSDAKQMCPGIELVEARHDVYVDYHNWDDTLRLTGAARMAKGERRIGSIVEGEARSRAFARPAMGYLRSGSWGLQQAIRSNERRMDR